MGDNISTVEGIQYSGGILSVQWGITSVQWGDNIGTVEVAQYSGDKGLKYFEFSKNLEIFSRAYFASKSDRPHRRTQLLTMADMVKDLGYKNLVLGKILLWIYDKLGFWKYFVNFLATVAEFVSSL